MKNACFFDPTNETGPLSIRLDYEYRS